MFVKEIKKGKTKGCSIDDKNKDGKVCANVDAKMKEGKKDGLYV